MGRPKGSKNKPKPECLPPDDRPSVPEDVKAQVFDGRIVVIHKPGDRLDGVYVVGKKPLGGNYVAKIGWCDTSVPITSELKKMLGIE